MYDYIVVNDEVSNAADKIIAIIRAEHARTKRTIDKYQKNAGGKIMAENKDGIRYPSIDQLTLKHIQSIS